jgi:hypothetical protein
VRANRRNGKKSRGPKTIEGKTRSARNALKHGLARPLLITPGVSESVEELALSWVGEKATPAQLEQARRAAAAQLDLQRIESVRQEILSGPWTREMPKSKRVIVKEFWDEQKLVNKIELLEQKPQLSKADEARMEKFEAQLRDAMSTPKTRQVEFTFGEIASELLALDRYERRARSLRKKALRELDKLTAPPRRAGG